MDNQDTEVTGLTRKRKGPAPTGKGVQVMLRVQPDLLAALDEWISNQPGFPPTRQQAIRHLVEKSIGFKKSVKKSRVGRPETE